MTFVDSSGVAAEVADWCPPVQFVDVAAFLRLRGDIDPRTRLDRDVAFWELARLGWPLNRIGAAFGVHRANVGRIVTRIDRLVRVARLLAE